ncbi:MAG TPA: CopD family protein [Bosea sp. (in: a-proteobacteria)]|jgi:copper transport protein|uniref:copper resistance CopC/CopD family protein n=1 Tax=Bosea sp. (in: a-proteobacteria) TaxID=1871050 RepID=UPI002E0DBB97|nr:CopD family protein [Bosea sp. (in: a-proteobacteria)]
MSVRLRLALCLLWAAVATIGIAGQAFAHAALTAASPADGAVVASAPARITLSFSEPVSPLVLKLIAPDGSAQPLSRYGLADRTLTIEAPAGLGQGTHVLSWRVVSEDGHPVGGAVVFSIGEPSATPPDALAQGDPAVRLMLWIGRVGLYLGLFPGVGGAAFAVWIAPLSASARRMARAMIVLGLVALPWALAAQGLDGLDASPMSLFDRAVWAAAVRSSFAVTALVAAAALLSGLVSLAPQGGVSRSFSALALLCAGAALAASGHASAASPQVLMRPAVFLHAVAIAAWAGALWRLIVALRSADAAGVLERFSRRILWIVVPLLTSGAVLAVVQVETPAALLTTAYGRVLLVKFALVAGLLALAAWNRYRLTGRALRRQGAALGQLRRVIAAEVLLMLAILGTAALWRFTPPPRALAIAATQPASIHIHTLEAMADVTLTPGRAGPVAVDVVLMNGEFGPLPAKELRLGLSNASAGVEPIERPAVRGDDGIWRVTNLSLPVPGLWTVELEILVSDFEMLRLGGTIDVQR